MSKFQRRIWFWITVVFGAGLLVLTLDQIVLHPGHIVPELGGDGAKNNFTYLYQCMYGKGYWFDGMNYPYGEHIVYTDGQPLLSVPFTFLHNVTQEKALAVMWMLISFSFLLSIIFVYRILAHFRVSPWFAMLFAGLIGIFSPQLFRLQGHYALSYACVIPMLFFWTIRYLETHRWRYPFYVFIIGCLMAFLHPYYAAMMLVWVLCFTVGYFIFIRGTFLQKLRHTLPLVCSVILILAVVAVVMKLTDPVKDRPQNPYNVFYEACAHIKQVITSAYSPVWQKGEKPRFYFVAEAGEGYSYIGLVCIITVFISLAASIYRSARQRNVYIVADKKVFSPVWVFMAFAALLISMGVPFIWHMQWLFDYFSFFKQFRSLGRFSWIFYYIIAIYTVVVLHTWYTRFLTQKRFIAGYAVIIGALAVWGYEASGYIKYARKLSLQSIYNYGLVFSDGEKNWSQFLAEHKMTGSDYQAILMLPFFHVGTEKLWVSDPGWLMMLGSKAALQLHLPMIDVMMSRSSWSQALKQVRIAGGPFSDKPLLREAKNRKPFLVLAFEESQLNPDQQYLLTASDYLGKYSQCNVYSCYPDRIAVNDEKWKDSIEKILPFMQRADTIIANDGVFYCNHYDSLTNNPHFFGAGGGPLYTKDEEIINKIPINVSPKDSELYEFSCWFLVGDKDYRSPYITLELLNDSGRIIGYPDALCKSSTENQGMWLLASAYFYIHPNCRSIRCRLINKPAPAYIAMDEMMLRPARSLVISKGADGKVLVNNHLLKNAP